MEKCIRGQIDISDMQFGFMPGRGTTEYAIFILRQLQEKHLAKNHNIYFAFIDLEKAFDRVPREGLWWALRRTRVVRGWHDYSEPIDVKVGVHQGSALSPLLFIIVLEALSREFCSGCPWELVYADDLVIAADNTKELITRLKAWTLRQYGQD